MGTAPPLRRIEGPLWRLLAVFATALFVMMTAIGVAVHDTATPFGPDRAVARRLGASPAVVEGGRQSSGHVHSRLTYRVVWLGSPWFAAVSVVTIAVWARSRRDRFGMALAIVAIPLAGLVTEYVLKPAFGRTRGLGNGLAYPSGTVAAATAVAVVVILLAYRHRGRRGALAACLTAVLPAAVTISVVRLGFHYPSDAFAGFAAATSIVLAVALALSAAETRRLTERVADGQPPARIAGS